MIGLTSNQSDDEVLELGTVLDGLYAKDVSEDGNDDVVCVVLGVLDDSVGEEEFNSGILEAVGGEEEGNTVPFNNITDLDCGLVGFAGIEHFLSLFHKSEGINEHVEVLVLR